MSVEVKPYSIGELATMYGVSVRTMHTWLKPIQSMLGDLVGRYYNLRQIRIIFDELGEPEPKKKPDA